MCSSVSRKEFFRYRKNATIRGVLKLQNRSLMVHVRSDKKTRTRVIYDVTQVSVLLSGVRVFTLCISILTVYVDHWVVYTHDRRKPA